MPQFGVSVPANQIPALRAGEPNRAHMRAVVTTTAGKLESFLTPPNIPSFKSATGEQVLPQYVQLQIEAGQSPGTVYFTTDSGTTPEVSATNGGLVATAPLWTTLAAADPLNSKGLGGGIRLVAITSTTNVQVFFGF